MKKNRFTLPIYLRSILLLLVVNPLFSCSTTKKTTRYIENTFEIAPVFQQGFSGFALYDPVDKKMLYTHNAEKYFTPASNTKLFTFYTGIKILGDSIPALKYTVRNDSLIFTATGDPSLLYNELPDSQVLDFLNDRKEKLFYFPPSYTEKPFGPGWAWDDYNAYYSAERSPFPIYGNRVRFNFDISDSLPHASPAFFQDKLLIKEKTTKTTNALVRKLGENEFDYRHFDDFESWERDIPFKYSSTVFVELLNDTLQNKTHLLKESLKNLNFDKTIYSLPADTIYKTMLQESDNFIAEQLLLVAAQKISDTLKTKIAIDYMKENYLQDLPDKPIWVDGSGLSRYNLFTPRTMVRLLEKIKDEVPYKTLFQLMAIGGETGTLRDYYKANEPYLFAKTGTLSNNHSLSGYLKTKSGKILIFSFMNSNYTVPTVQLKYRMEQIIKSVRDNY